MSTSAVASRVDPIDELTVPVAHHRALLLRELAAQEAQAAECRATTSYLMGQTDVDSLLEREIAAASSERAEEAIADVRLALIRLEDGTYGACERCGAGIPAERLEAIPYARHCVGCRSLVATGRSEPRRP
jgi:RNA polymerase-binding transcription factor DksA